MARRIGLWALAGAAVAFTWFFYFTWLTWGAYHGGPGFHYGAVAHTLVNITIPFALLGLHNHYAITWYVSLILNAASYACIGLAVEGLRQTVRAKPVRLRH
jgi:hypothetical protein